MNTNLIINFCLTPIQTPLASCSAQRLVLRVKESPLNILLPISQLAAELNTDVAVTVPLAFEYTKSIVMVSMLLVSHDNVVVTKFSEVMLQPQPRDRIAFISLCRCDNV